MKFYIFNLKKDINIIIKNALIFIIILVLSLQIYGVYWFNYEYKLDEILQKGGFTSSTTKLTLDKINKLLEEEYVNNIEGNINLEKNKLNVKNINVDELKNKFIGVEINANIYNHKENKSFIYKGEHVNYDDDDNVVEIPNFIFEYYGYNLGDKINLNGKDFTIKGVSGFETGQSFIFSINGAKSIGLNNINLRITPKKNISLNDMEDFIKLTEGILGEEVNKPNFALYTNDGNAEIFMFLSVVLILAMLIIILVYNYFLNERKYRRSVYRIEGASFKKILIYSIIEITVIFMISFIFSIIFVEIFNNIFMKEVLLVNRYSLPIENYLLIAGVYYFVYLILVLINNRKLLKENILLK